MVDGWLDGFVCRWRLVIAAGASLAFDDGRPSSRRNGGDETPPRTSTWSGRYPGRSVGGGSRHLDQCHRRFNDISPRHIQDTHNATNERVASEWRRHDRQEPLDLEEDLNAKRLKTFGLFIYMAVSLFLSLFTRRRSKLALSLHAARLSACSGRSRGGGESRAARSQRRSIGWRSRTG